MSNESAPTEPSPSPFDDEPTVEAAASDAAATKPRLSILHLMVWTATSATVLAVQRYLGGINSTLTTFEAIYRIGFGIYGGVVVGGVLMWIARVRRHERFPVEPGEWLLLIQGWSVILLAIISVLKVHMHQIEHEYKLFPLAFLVIGLWPAFCCRQGRAWRWFFSVLALFYCTPLILLYPVEANVWAAVGMMRIFAAIASILMGFSTLSLIGAVATDLGKGIQRGWVHWVGVMTALIFVLFHIALAVI
jgi:hypothetical protein